MISLLESRFTGVRSGLLVGIAMAILVLLGAAGAVSANAAMPPQYVPIELTLQSGQSSPPSIFPPIWNSTYDWPQGDGYNTWTESKQTPLPQGYQLTQGLNGQPGLWLWPIGSPAAGDKYPPGYAEYFFRAPGTTRIARASVDVSFRPALYNHHCTDIGLRSDTAVGTHFRDCSPPTPGSTTTDTWGPVHSRNVALFDSLTSPAAKEAFVRLEKPLCNGSNQLACLKYIPDNDAAAGGSYLRAKAIAMTLVDDDLPVVTPSGAFHDLSDTYIDGKQVYPLTVDSSDAGAGIYASQFDHTLPTPPATTETLHEKLADCDPAHHSTANGARICPPSDSFSISVDTNPFPEGTNKFRAWAVDPAGNVDESRWNVIVDRTAPPAPPNIRFLTPDEGSGQVAWDESVDPVLADGTPGSGTTHYRYRSQVNGGTWTDWAEIDAPRQITNEVFDRPIGTVIGFEVTAVDLVGNESGASSLTSIVRGKAPTVAIGGPLGALNGQYTNGSDPVVASLAARDDEAGVAQVRLTEQPNGALDALRLVPCTDANQPFAPGKNTCPLSYNADVTVPFPSLSEGAHTFHASVVDRAGNAGAKATTNAYVDRTPPDVPDAEFFTEDTSVLATWEESDDPALPDGVDGSGLSHYEWRARTDTEWSAWESVTEPDTTELTIAVGTAVAFEVRSVDRVGNRSAVAAVDGVVGVEEDDGTPVGGGSLTMDSPITPPATPTVVSVQGRRTGSGCTVGVRLRIPSGTPADGPNAVEAQGLSTDPATCVSQFLISTPPDAWNQATSMSMAMAASSGEGAGEGVQSLASAGQLDHTAGYMHGWWEDPNPLAITVNEVFSVIDWNWDGSCISLSDIRDWHTSDDWYTTTGWGRSSFREKKRRYCRKIFVSATGRYRNDEFCQTNSEVTRTSIYTRVEGFRRGGIDGRARGNKSGGCASLLDFNQKLKRTAYD